MSSAQTVDQLFLITVAGEQMSDLTQALNREGFYVTVMDSSGGLIDERLSTLLIGLNHARQAVLLEHIRDKCRTRRRLIPTPLETPSLSFQPMMIEAETGGAVVYVLDVDHFEQL